MRGPVLPASRRRATGHLVRLACIVMTLAAVVTLRPPLTVGAVKASVANPLNTASTVGYFTCASAAVGIASTKAYLAYPFAETGPTTAADVSGNGRAGAYSLLGVTYGAAGPCPRDGHRAITLDGLTGSISGAATPTNPQTFSLEIWFRTTVGGGKLIGLGNLATGPSSSYDRHLYLTDSGKLTFGVYPGAVRTITSPASYLDGAWHDAVATLGPSTDPNPGMRLYVDGALVASDPTTTSAEANSGYWRIGYDNLAGWGPTQPTNFHFTGSLAFASTYTYVLTPAQVSGHRRAGV